VRLDLEAVSAKRQWLDAPCFRQVHYRLICNTVEIDSAMPNAGSEGAQAFLPVQKPFQNVGIAKKIS
jgi:hypothetical protein